jgi:CBS domain-containing protein
MTADVWCVGEDLDSEIATQLLLDRNIGGAPVVDSVGRPVGVISRTDLLRERNRSSRVREIMTPMVFALPERATVAQAAALMAFERVHRLPVVSEDGRVVGVVSSIDLVAWLAPLDGSPSRT